MMETYDADSGVAYAPYVDATLGTVGFFVTYPDGKVSRIYMNPSDGSDDGVPTVFIYQGITGDPAHDAAITHFDMSPDEFSHPNAEAF